jgi:hypothetical protein
MNNKLFIKPRFFYTQNLQNLRTTQMKIIRLTFIIAFALFSFQAKAQQVIATSGGYFEGENLSLSWTLGEPVTETFSNGGVILTQGFQQPYNFYLQQILNIPAGWSGISSYLDPMNKGVEVIFAPYQSDFIILASMEGVYFPLQNINTIGDWDYHTGYQVKAANPFEVTLAGTRIHSPGDMKSPGEYTLALTQGWSLLPVLSPCDVDVAGLFAPVVANLDIVKDVAGWGVYWPAMNINTIGSLHPGKAYFVRTSGDVEVTFGGCEKKDNGNGIPTLTGFETLSGLGLVTVTPTPSSHTIAIRPEVLKNLEPGTIIGIFDQAGTCHSLSPASDETHCLTAFGQDQISSQANGFQEGDPFIIKILNPETGDDFLAEAEYDLSLPNAGNFVQNGLSAIKSLKTTGTGNFGESQIAISVYPNPSTSVFNISLSEQVSDLKWEVTGAYGALILEGNSGQNTFTIDLSTLPIGIYYLKMDIGGLRVVKKLVLQ